MQIHVRFARAATRLTNWTQRWVPGTFTIAWFLTLIVLILGVTAGRASFLTCVAAWGDGFWELLPFSMQMCLIMFTGSVVAVSPPVRRALAWLASRPRTPRQSILLVALCSMLLALIHWGISIVGSAVLVRELGRRRAGADYRLLLAAAYLGMGTTWHAGLSASAPLLVATPGHFLESEIGIIPVSAGMYGIIRETHLAESLAGVFVAGATAHTYPVIVYWYSGIVNYFVPSGGSKWAIEAPYILAAGKTLGVPAAKVVTAYAWGDMVTDIIQPFWAIPLLAAARLDFREILGFCMILFCIYAPVVTLAFLLFPR